MTASRFVIAVFAGLTAVAGFAQAPPPAGTADPNSQAQPANNTTRGQRDSSQRTGNRNNQADNADPTKPASDAAKSDPTAPLNLEGPEIVDDPNATPEQKASAEYSGPAVLSRGISASEPMNPRNIKFTPTLGLEYVVNSGLTGTVVQPGGKLQNDLSQGVQASYGLKGEKVLKHDILSLSFTGNYYHYTQNSGLDGTDDQMALTWRHSLSRHISFGIVQSLQEYNRNNLLLSGAQSINSGEGTNLLTTTPSTEAFDGRVFSSMSQGSMTWQINPRLSMNFSGAGFFTRRASSSLYGDTGYQAGGDIVYRITRSVTAGAYYGYTHFDYTGIYGGSDINTVGLTYSIAFNPRTQLVTKVGGSRIETTGLSSVALDPLLAALLGTPGTVEAVYLKNYAPDMDIQIRHQVTNMDFSLAYTRGVTPGNGVILTSVRQSANAGIGYRLRRKWNMSGTTGYDTLSGFGSTNQKYASVFAGASVYRTIAKHLDWHARFDIHHFTFDNTGFLRNSLVFSTGIIWSPGDLLNRLW